MEENQPNILADLITETELTQASGGKRFINFIVDYLFFILVFICFCMVWAVIDPAAFGRIADENNGSGSLWINFLALIIFILLYSLMEFLTKGRSIGKFITGTKVVNDHDGSNISIGQAFKRSLSRLVPFELFSALGTPSYPWHDKWTRSYVIDIKRSSIVSDDIHETYSSQN